MRVDDFDYDLPAGLIAQRPLDRRDGSRLLLVERTSGQFQDALFADLPDFLTGEELIVFNNARVIPARLFGKRLGVHSQHPARKTVREHLSGNVEVFLTRKLDADIWEALVRPGRKMQVGEQVQFGAGELEAEVLSRGELGIRTVRFTSRNKLSAEENLELLGHVPLPPYIDRPDEASDRQRYQTVYARRPGAVAAPTAGLHFTPEILDELKAKSCELCEVTLDVGLGTFQPVHAETLEEHKIHSEAYEITAEVVEKIRQAKSQSRPILAVGTTVIRTLEDAAARAASAGGRELLSAGRGEAEIFLLPGHNFRVVDKLLTNFHLPKSTLLALVSAFAGRENILQAYRHAVAARYRFYSYGDCMLIR
ncbi:MAG TPA: tRNA preQ1(34) S-adenosylmethionine ribosyltransferase-isomerase QueA [Candidatus Sulfotelmatobacter sp.]|nr:tRNA preQ1(34) S-adenosylmethionine ribosyltransferase-isomerase QueA [Candidatus Sulfotelmatobacter sp.]